MVEKQTSGQKHTTTESNDRHPATNETTSGGSGSLRSPQDVGAFPLGIGDFESPGEPKPYAVLKQIPLSPRPDGAPFGFCPCCCAPSTLRVILFPPPPSKTSGSRRGRGRSARPTTKSVMDAWGAGMHRLRVTAG